MFIYSAMAGNTRYAILSELYQETGDERFRRIQCIFAMAGTSEMRYHLAENEMRGDLSFIERRWALLKHAHL